MKSRLFAIFDRNGFVRATKRPASIHAHERGIEIEVEMDDSAFDDGYLHASIKAPKDSLVLPEALAIARRVDADQDEGELD